MAAPRLLFVCDAGLSVGGGHVMRSLTLADALAVRGVSCSFEATPPVAAVLDVFDDRRHGRIEGDTPDSVDILAASAARLAPRFDGVVVDHFLWGREHDALLRAHGVSIFAIDDLGDRERDVDVLVDPTLERDEADYASLLPDPAVRLLTPRHALVRPAFAAVRETALERRRSAWAPARVLISLGLTDLGGITGQVLDALAVVRGDVTLDVVVGSGAATVPVLSERLAGDRHAILHVDAADMPSLMLRADVAIGAGGSSTWERACLGLPTITLVLADNQRPLARRLEAAGATIVIDVLEPDWPDQLRSAWTSLLTDGDQRRRLSEGAADLCDGLGAERVADTIVRRLTA